MSLHCDVCAVSRNQSRTRSPGLGAALSKTNDMLYSTCRTCYREINPPIAAEKYSEILPEIIAIPVGVSGVRL